MNVVMTITDMTNFSTSVSTFPVPLTLRLVESTNNLIVLAPVMGRKHSYIYRIVDKGGWDWSHIATASFQGVVTCRSGCTAEVSPETEVWRHQRRSGLLGQPY